MTTFLDRLKKAMSDANKTKTDLWRACKISSGAVSQWFSKPTTQLRGKNLLLVARELNVRPEWLVSGEGEMKSERGIFDELVKMPGSEWTRMIPVKKTITFQDETRKKQAVTINTYVGYEVSKDELARFVTFLYEMRPEFRSVWFQFGNQLSDPHGMRKTSDAIDKNQFPTDKAVESKKAHPLESKKKSTPKAKRIFLDPSEMLEDGRNRRKRSIPVDIDRRKSDRNNKKE